MSIHAVSWALNLKVGSPTLKLVLIAVANYADENGCCWPSQERIAKDTELTDRAVREALKKLQSLGFIERSDRRINGAKRQTDIIHLRFRQRNDIPLATPQEPASAGEPPEPPSGGDQRNLLPVEEASPPERHSAATGTSFRPPPERRSGKPSIEPSGEPSESARAGSRRKATRAPPAYTPEFEFFWNEYPRRKGVSKAEAFAVWVVLSPADQEAAIDGAIAYARDGARQQTPERFICHPTTFLNQRRWESWLEQRDAAE
jgi:hypothetical protein